MEDYWSRGYLPHHHVPDQSVFITWRLADSLPTGFFEAWKSRPEHLREKNNAYRTIDIELDKGIGSCALANHGAALRVSNAIIETHRKTADVYSFVVMPNHVHLLCKLNENTALPEYVRSIKGKTAREINVLLGKSGKLWQPDYFDRTIRNEEHFRNVSKYIEWNPARAGLVVSPSEYPFSTANEVIRKKLASQV